MHWKAQGASRSIPIISSGISDATFRKRCLYQSHAHQEDSATMLGAGDVAVVCSMNGSYFSHYGELTRKIYQSGATVVVLTQNRFAQNLNRADYVLFCGDSNQNDIGKYAALFTIDLMVMSYIRRLKTGETEDE